MISPKLIEKLREEFDSDLKSSRTAEDFGDLRVKYLGRKQKI